VLRFDEPAVSSLARAQIRLCALPDRHILDLHDRLHRIAIGVAQQRRVNVPPDVVAVGVREPDPRRRTPARPRRAP
jgi:hypothetical protein